MTICPLAFADFFWRVFCSQFPGVRGRILQPRAEPGRGGGGRGGDAGLGRGRRNEGEEEEEEEAGGGGLCPEGQVLR